ncbi:unnamed protein product [marine sediment metagenome]|uniref:HTH crp-type domain-containing protein n=1 Tax=marine sediment metagenome TaxID=412755 RepID=X0TVV5_9ZZZZ
MKKGEEIEIRSIKRGKWYWIDKSILKNYASELKSSGLAVYNVLAYFANSKTQSCFPTQRTIANLIGLSRRTVSRKIRLFKNKGLIAVERMNGRFKYFLLYPKESKVHRACDKKDTSVETRGNTNKNNRIRINNNVNEDKKTFNMKSFKEFKPMTRKELLASDLAKGLNDSKSLPFYLSVVRQYPEPLLMKLLGEVREIPSENIKKSRAALFNYLLQQYAKENSKNNRN